MADKVVKIVGGLPKKQAAVLEFIRKNDAAWPGDVKRALIGMGYPPNEIAPNALLSGLKQMGLIEQPHEEYTRQRRPWRIVPGVRLVAVERSVASERPWWQK